MAHDALGAHARDELGLSTPSAARPVQGGVLGGGLRVGAAGRCWSRW
jgi:hypothetical protein